MLAIFSLLLVLVLSLLITRVATIALTYTGLSRQAAKFQARSAFTGVGFTTAESEKVVNHPVRRRILLLMMLVGNAGIVTVIATFVLGFIQLPSGSSVVPRVLLLASGLTLLVSLSMSSWMDQRLSKIISWALKRYTDLEIKDYAAILHLAGEYSIHELYVRSGDWMADRNLMDLKLPDEGVLVLGIVRNHDTFMGTPRGETEVRAGDTLILYGRNKDIADLDQRREGPGGNIKHAEAVAVQKIKKKEEE
ncbi:MAG: TrkA C-terminal domain-containing protein [Deltaproteobacteria bacterium]|nr:TrkA C-terminal domain-containing protein [Deltaproteobacteria bacterium]